MSHTDKLEIYSKTVFSKKCQLICLIEWSLCSSIMGSGLLRKRFISIERHSEGLSCRLPTFEEETSTVWPFCAGRRSGSKETADGSVSPGSSFTFLLNVPPMDSPLDRGINATRFLQSRP